MKIVIAFIFLITAHSLKAQPVAEQVADKIATRMKDSLSLSSAQKGQLFAVNMQLHNQKMVIRQQYATSDSLRIKLQRVESTRDSLYGQVLTEQQFITYKQKKRNLVNNN